VKHDALIVIDLLVAAALVDLREGAKIADGPLGSWDRLL
jgi:hypothetical protein